MSVTASISTKDRYFTTLPLAISAIAAQTVKPKQLIIFDDGEFKDLREISPYCHLFPLLMSQGIQWFHLPGQRKGQVANHATTLDRADTEFVWRLDDDNAPAPTCLERLLKRIDGIPGIGAVGGLIHDPRSISPRPKFVTGKIEEILNPFNLAWYQWSGPAEEVDHLYSTFLYRVETAKKAGGYNKNLSPVGHREETMFSHEIKRAGYKLVIAPDALTWHFREGKGGIRSYTDGSLWDKDEKVFRAKLLEWGVIPREYKMVVLNSGLGDHFMFKSILPELLEKNKDKKVVLANCYPEVFEDIKNVEMASIADAIAAFQNLDQWDIYRWCEERNWKKHLVEAFREMYL
jgi:glycosyltransferase involved in cell wall biosynthesis